MCGHRERGWLETRTRLYIKWTAEGVAEKSLTPSIPRREAYVSCGGYDGIPERARVIVKQGGTADVQHPSLTKTVGGGFLCLRTRRQKMRKGRFGPYGGQYIPQILMDQLQAIEAA